MRFERMPGPHPAPPRRHRLALTLTIFAFACAFVVQSPGWAQTSYMALTKALSQGTPQIDRWHWATHDISYTGGHYYSVKPPGLVLATLPLYRALEAAGARGVARDARIRAESEGGAPWASRKLPAAQYGFSAKRAVAARTTIVDDAPMTWALGLLGVVVPAVLLLLLVARGAERIAPGTGVATAVAPGHRHARARRCTSPNPMPSRRPASRATTRSASTTTASSGSRCRARTPRSSCCSAGVGC